MLMNHDFKDQKTLEKFSSVYTLSDMEIFVFPELFYPLVLANIMSPVIWEWRTDPWFKNINKKSFTYKINRIKQYIMDHYVFNLDLETWGLTKKDRELQRFKDYIDTKILAQSNALFGYEGDKYYFDIDIRRHFGLDKYDSDVIPYWKTETIEAMTAFRYKESFENGAGECVSFSALYAAALFIIGEIPLENIYLMGTPLHSQNFIDVSEGILTNNRRIVSKTMWFNGTSISTMARRALEHEKVTVVSHITGNIHYLYDKATINREAFLNLRDKLSAFLTAPLSAELFINFLRYHMKFKKYFQYRHFMNGHHHYLPVERLFEYEHSTKHIFSLDSNEVLLSEIEEEEFSLTPLNERIILQEIIDCFGKTNGSSMDEFKSYCMKVVSENKKITEDKLINFFNDLEAFLKVEPRLPDSNKKFITTEALNINTGMSREEIFELIEGKAPENEMALLALYTYRQMDKIDWKPFIKASIERNPVSLEELKNKTPDEAYQVISQLSNISIYNGKRLAQPDEVWNFRRGDGVEKAFLLANFLFNRTKVIQLQLSIQKQRVILQADKSMYEFHSSKQMEKEINIAN